VIYKDIIKI